MKSLLKKIAIVSFAVLFAVSCGEKIDPDNGNNNGEEQISDVELQRRKTIEATLKYLKDDIFGGYYFWYKEMKDVPYTYQTDIYKFFDKLLVPQDRWSWMMDGQDYLADESGVVYGTYGVSMAQPFTDQGDYDVYVRFVYPGGPFDKAGVKRGWKFKKAGPAYLPFLSQSSVDAFNDLFEKPSTTEYCDFIFIDNDGNEIPKSILAVETLTTRPCLEKAIFTSADYPGLTEPVGYFHYLSFKADRDSKGKHMLDDIVEPMAYFKEHNVKTLIVDLRYNGGGDSRASDLLVSYLAPASAVGQVYVNRMHNDKLAAKYDESTTVATPAKAIAALKSSDKSLNLSCEPDSPEFERLYFITGRGSASASEMTLNGLKPLANVHHVGQVTYGKPNGMYVFYYPKNATEKTLKYVFLPICFYNANGQGTFIPDSGIVPENERPDDMQHDFGVEEDNIAACLYHIVNGTYPESPSPKSKTSRKGEQSGFKISLTPEEKDPHYGIYTVKPNF